LRISWKDPGIWGHRTLWDKIFKPVDTLEKGLEASWLRNAVIRNNIANAETPGFKSSNVEFESLFAASLEDSGFHMKRTNPKHIEHDHVSPDEVTALVKKDRKTGMRMDGNNVDIEDENVKLAQNSLYYNTILTKMNSELSRLRMAINEGK
jgi:flagellar basal-body rod protein FlgB